MNRMCRLALRSLSDHVAAAAADEEGEEGVHTPIGYTAEKIKDKNNVFQRCVVFWCDKYMTGDHKIFLKGVGQYKNLFYR